MTATPCGLGPASSSPPKSITRSRMPTSPFPPLSTRTGGGTAAPVTGPSSLTSTSRWSCDQDSRTVACPAPECFSVLVSASWTMR